MLTWSSSLEMVAACCAMVAAETCAYKMYTCIQKEVEDDITSNIIKPIKC